MCFFNKRSYNKEFIINGSTQFTFTELIDNIARFCELPPPKKRVSASFMMIMASMMEFKARIINIFKPHYRPLITRFQVRILSEPLRLNSDFITKELGFKPKIDFKQRIEGLKDYVIQCSSTGLDSK